jgi:hypothetical protein
VAALCHLGDDLFVDRRDVVEGLGRADPLAADPVLGRDLDALDLGRPARGRRSSRSWGRSVPNGMAVAFDVSNADTPIFLPHAM